MRYIFILVALLGVLFGTEKKFDIYAGEVKLHCRVMGVGKPLIVINGGPGLSHDHLLPHMNKLAEDNLVIFYDQRGCGLSDCVMNHESLSIENMIKDIDLIRSHFGLKKVSILGHSWGGLLAMNYVIANPQNIEKLVVSNPAPASTEGIGIYYKTLVKVLEPFNSEIIEMGRNSSEKGLDKEVITESLNYFFQIFFHDKEKSAQLDFQFTEESARRYSLASDLISQTMQAVPFDLRPGLKDLDLKTLIIHGESDVLPLQIMERIQESIEGSELFVQAECGHFPMIEKPDEYFAKLKEFLSD
jgi:proline iminopeptidase